MNNQENIFEMFDKVRGIEPSSDWETRLWQKLDDKRFHKKDVITGRIILSIAAIILIINAFAFTKGIIASSQQQSSTRLKSIATEFLVTTNSSKY